MRRINFILVLPFIFFILLVIDSKRVSSQPADHFINPITEAKIDSLLSQMTLEEKVAQLIFIYYQDSLFWNTPGDSYAARHDIAEGLGMAGIAGFDQDPEDFARWINDFQRGVIKKNSHDIPALIYGEGLHGFYAKNATSFPQAIALGCSWNTSLVQKCMDVTALEMRARGVTHAFSPNVDLARDPRWGRIDETYGEDPWLVGKMAVAAVKGLQGTGNEFLDGNHVAATAKHFVAHSIPENGTNTAPSFVPERECRETFLLPFEMAIKEASVATVMSTYHEIDGIPMTANEKFMKEIVKGEMNFNGFILSDYGAVDQMITTHKVAKSEADAAKQSLRAGLDVDLMKEKQCFPKLVDLVKSGKVKEKLVDKAVRRVLRVKLKMKLPEEPYADVNKISSVNHTEAHRNLSRKAAHESMVLLKNRDEFLPLNEEEVNSLAVIGPNAEGIHLGSYSYEPRSGISVLEGIRDFANGKFKVNYAKGCKFTKTDGLFWTGNNAQPGDPGENKRRIDRAVEVAEKSDVLLVVVGGNETTNREAWAVNHLGDRDNLRLLPPQRELIAALEETGKPMVVLLINGRPLAVPELKKSEQVKALIEGWYLGEMTGPAVADVLFGKVNPSGKLSVTIPKNVGQLPVYYYHKPSRKMDYIFSEAEPLYPFGYGLSFTTFEYTEPALSNQVISAGGETQVSVKVTNTGSMAGKEVVQLYIRDEIASVTRPVKQLRGFEKISLEPGETKKVTFSLGKKELQFYNREMKRIVEPGAFKIMVGRNSNDLKETVLRVEDN